MKNTLKAIIPVLAAGLLWAGSAIAADKVTIGVSIPAAHPRLDRRAKLPRQGSEEAPGDGRYR